MAAFLIVAGEASGDAIGAELVAALHKLKPGVRLLGAAGPELQASGVETIVETSALSVMGLVEVAPRLPSLIGALRRLESAAVDGAVQGAILIDAPDFNLRLARRLKRRGIPVVQYVSPTIWAWRRRRLRGMERTLDRLLLTLPFERQVYARSRLDTVYVGHPVLDRIPENSVDREAVGQRWGVPVDRPWVALLPGSREHETQRMAPLIGRTAAIVRARCGEVALITAIAPGSNAEAVTAALGVPDLHVVDADRHAALSVCDAAIATSGTVSLELAAMGVPHVVAYRTSRLSFLIARRLVHTDAIALPNLIAGRHVVPEFLQEDARPEALAAPVARWLTDNAARLTVRRDLESIRTKLGPRGVAERAARAALEVFGNNV